MRRLMAHAATTAFPAPRTGDIDRYGQANHRWSTAVAPPAVAGRGPRGGDAAGVARTDSGLAVSVGVAAARYFPRVCRGLHKENGRDDRGRLEVGVVGGWLGGYWV